MEFPDTYPVQVGPGLGRRRVGFLPTVAALLTLGWLAGRCGLAEGASGTVHQQFGNGLRMSIDTRWGDGFGYRPVRINVAPLTPLVADRSLQVELLMSRRSNPDWLDLRVVQSIELPAGSGPGNPVQATLSVPHHVPWSSYKINVSEDGKLLEKLSTGWTQVSDAQARAQLHEILPVMLVVGDQLPDTSRLVAPFPNELYSQFAQWQAPRPRSGAARPQLPIAVSCSLGELSQRWIDYSSLDVVCLSLGELAQLEKNHPQTLQAVLDWAAAGGNLWVYGVGWEWHRLGELERLVGLRLANGQLADPTDRGWQKPGQKLYDRRFHGAWSGSSGTVEARYSGERGRPGSVTRSDKAANPKRENFGTPAQPHFVYREYAMGLIVALAPDDPFPGTPAEWRCVLNAVGPDRLLWYRREGVSMVRPNRDYWDFLIPDVGLAPVVEFLVLITVFVLAVGPANYWLLRRWQRLYLLVVTIPASAATVTLVLFGYAVLADGLGTRVRVRSLTQIDQRRKQAVCRARLSYYCGLAPRRGLTFPEDVAVLPLQERPVHRYRDQPLRRELIWEEDQQLRSGWLNSRTPTQYLTIRSRQTDRGLQVIGSPGDNGGLRVKNRLDTPIEQLAVCWAANQYYWATAVDAEATVTLESTHGPRSGSDCATRGTTINRGCRGTWPVGAGVASSICRTIAIIIPACGSPAPKPPHLASRPAAWNSR